MLTATVIIFKRTQKSDPETGIVINNGPIIIDITGEVVEQVWSWQFTQSKGVMVVPVN